MKKNILAAALFAAVLSSSVFADSNPKYISPNSDGVQDSLEIPLKITDKRYVQSWSLVIMDSDHQVVRTIGNKQALPSKVGVKQFFKQAVTAKSGVAIPEKVVWNGALDSGETAPDGLYYYYFTATDDNGNEGRTSEYQVIVDTVAPDVEVKQPTDKIFGEGAKAQFKVSQTGSEEDLWIGTFKTIEDTENGPEIKVVKTFKWTNSEPITFSWNGTNDEGSQVRDGVYTYEVTATDRAGNTAPYTTITNIIYSAEKPATNIFIAGSRYFSPGTDSEISTLVFDVTIPVPDAKSGNSLTDWSVNICDEKGNVVRSYNKAKDGDVPPKTITFDGKDDSGAKLADGSYQAKLSASYLNGYVPPVLSSPMVVLDTVKPNANPSVSDKSFGSSNKRSVEITLNIDQNNGAPIPSWTGKIMTQDGKTTVKTYDFGEFPPKSVTWAGIGDDGKLAEDATYVLVLAAKDMAGNSGVDAPSPTFTLDTTEAELLLDASEVAFSPNGDKVKDTITFTPIIKGEVVKYDFSISDKSGNKVFVKSGTGKNPANFVWNGKADDGILCKDGTYSAVLSLEMGNGSTPSASIPAFDLDTVPPSLTAETPWTYFSPDGDGNQDNIPVKVTGVTNEKIWSAEVRNSKNVVIRKYTWNGAFDSMTWDGSDESGNVAANGKYSIVFASTDEAGNKFATELKELVLDNRETKACITTENEGISPNGDKFLDTQKFEISTTVKDDILSWSFDISKEDGSAVRSWSSKDGNPVPASITWDGLDSTDKVCEGTYTGKLQITYKKGNRVSAVSSPFICTATPPQLRVQTAVQSGSDYFSPDNDGTDDDLFIKLTGSSKAKIKNWSFVIKDPRGKDFWRTNGKSQITERIVWDGLSNVQKNKATGKAELVQSATDYPYEFKATDELGMTSTVTGKIPVDVLVIREGNILKMAVPSIIFLSDEAEFQNASKNLTEDQVRNNIQILNRIADILKKFKDYKVTIVGHANRITDNPAEETEDNPREWGKASTPLSLKRAEAIKAYLVKRGVSASNLSTDGKGGTQPVADPKDKDNNWKNRRVEFILQK